MAIAGPPFTRAMWSRSYRSEVSGCLDSLHAMRQNVSPELKMPTCRAAP